MTTYTLTVTDGENATVTTVSFTTGTASGQVAPRLERTPSIYPAKKDPFAVRTSCSSNAERYTVVFPIARDETTASGQLLLEGVQSLSEDGLDGEPNYFGRCTPTLGEGECALAVVTADRPPSYFRARLIDWAGNASEPSEVQVLRGCGCGSAEGAAALLALGVLLRRRRRDECRALD